MTNGWSNYETWNVALWITNDHRTYKSAVACKSYDEFVKRCHKRNVYQTPDGVSLVDAKINKAELIDIWEHFLDETG
jgi:cupin superfamily acireductone dioxygenase involved in methionine salvage